MKRFLLALLVLMPLLVFGQNKQQKQKIISATNIKVLKKLAKKSERKFKTNKAKALKIAKEKDWIIRKEFDRGAILELQGVTESGHPLYYITHNYEAARTISTNKLWTGGSLGLSLTGNGMLIGEWDGSAALSNHQEFGGRVTVKDGAAPGEHSTHVAGTMIAAGVDIQAKGMAYEANLDSYEWTNDESEMASAASAGLLISNHSYGYGTGWTWNGTSWVWAGTTSISNIEDFRFGFYSNETRNVDVIANNAPYYLICKSAGNDRGNGPGTTPSTAEVDGGADGYDCIGWVGNAKNILTIGAVDPLVTGWTQASDVKMSSFSSWGPTDDGRIKPDICGNGVDVYSASDASTSSYTTMNGTSMSSPNVAGSSILLQQHYNNLNATFMLASTLKALIIHTADEAGPNDGPDYMFGWGLMNTASAANLITQKNLTTHIKEATLNNGATYTLNIVANGNEPIIATIVWNDPAGTPVADALDPTDIMLVNDLDMRIGDGTTTFYPWMLDGANPANAATTGDNIRDNVEQVYIANPTCGATYTINVTHKGTLGASQDFSLIVSGFTTLTTDAAINNINPQVTSCEFSNNTPIDIEIGNNGSASLSNILVTYEIRKPDNSLVGNGNYTIANLNSCSTNTTIVYADMSINGEIYTINVDVSVSGDENSTNNSLEKKYTAVNVDLTTPGDTYTQNFEGVGSLGEIGWSMEDVNGDGGQAVWYPYNGAGLGNAASDYFAIQFSGAGSGTADDWMFTPCLYLKAGQDYDISYWVKEFQTQNEQITLYIGSSPTAAAMTTILEAGYNPTTTWIQRTPATFNVASDGIYYIGWHSYNTGTSYAPAVDDVTIINNSTVILPQVTTNTVTNITGTSADGAGEVTNIGSSAVTERGIVYSTSINPTTANNVVTSGSGLGTFTGLVMTPLTSNTTYYVRAYAINSSGTSYGDNVSFTTLPDPPTISTIIPDNFYADLGKQITINGSDFIIITSVTLGGITGSVVSNDGTTMVVDFPAGSYSDNTLVVTNASGSGNGICTVNTRNTIPVGNGTDSHTTITSALNGLFAWWGTTAFDADKIIDVYTGTYAETVTPNVTLIPTAANMLVIQAHTDDTPVINATGNANGIYIGALNYVKIEGFTVYGATNDNIYTEGDYNQILFNRCYGSTAASGIKLNASLNSVVTNNLLYANYNYGLHLAASDNLTVKNNTVYDNGYSLTGPQTFVKSFSGSVSIPDNGCAGSNYANATINVSENVTITNVRVLNMNITHTYDSDLSIYLIHPDATSVTLSVGNGGSGNNYTNTNFDDASGTLISAGSAPFTGTYSPEGSLSAFDAKTSSGNWNLRVCDNANLDVGTIDSWQLEITYVANINVGAGLYVESGTLISLENNIFAAKTGTDYVALKTDVGSSITTNYNNYYKDAGNTNLVNYLGVNYADFAAWPNEGANDLESNPLFVNAGIDFHLQSTFGSFQGGQWPPISAIAGTWTNDASLSPAIDAGNADAFANEPAVNGSIINLGCYGNTQQASKSGASTGTAGLWTGAISTNWVVSGNWDDGNVPIESSNVVIPSVSNLPLIDADAVCNNLTINTGAALTIDVTGYINVGGTITNNAGTSGLLLNSSASGDAALIYNNTGIDVTVQRYLYAPVSSKQWHYLSSPITAAPVSLFNVDFYNYDESTDDWWTGSTLYGTSGWTIPTGNLIPLNGYIFNNSETTINFTGQLNFNGGDYNVAINYTEHAGNAANGDPYTNFDAWNLVGNPYTSELDWEAITKTNVDATIYYYDDLAHNYAYYIDGVGGVNGGSRFIPAMQAFFVKASSNTGGTLTIPLTARVHTGESLFKNASKNVVNNVLRLQVTDKNYTDELLITLSNNASLLFDNELDAYKRFSWDSNIPQVYSLNTDKNLSYAINSLPLSVAQHIIPLGFRFANEGNYTLNVSEFNFADYHVFLENTVTNDFVNLRDIKEINIAYDENTKADRYRLNILKNTAPVVNAYISDKETEINTNLTFTIAENTFIDIDLGDKLTYTAKLSNGNSLPKWLNFDAQKLSFTGTATELQVFDIEIEAKDLLGEAVSTGFKLSVKSTTDIESINDNEFSVKVYPNPNRGKFVIQVDGKYKQISYEIISISGKLMRKAEIKNEISNQIDVSDIANGTYIINLTLDNKINIKKSIVIEY